jgi:hypothetical protein
MFEIVTRLSYRPKRFTVHIHREGTTRCLCDCRPSVRSGLLHLTAKEAYTYLASSEDTEYRPCRTCLKRIQCREYAP